MAKDKDKDKDKKLPLIPAGITPEEYFSNANNTRTALMAMAVEFDIAPLEYSLFYQQYKASGKSIFADPDDSDNPDDDVFQFDYPIDDMKAIPDADKKTLRLRIQLHGIKKPPLWREVEIPATYNFHKLHTVIQQIFGWTNSHLWQFGQDSYADIDSVGFEDDCMYDPDETPVTGVLKGKGDKFFYRYDFGDDWVHDIKVLEVEDKVIPHPVLLKWKGDNPLEDCGGSWGYQRLREAYQNVDKMTAKEKKEFLDNEWCGNISDFILTMKNLTPDQDIINKELKKI